MATVSDTAGTPTGSVQFEIDGVDTGARVTLSGGIASFSTSALTATSHTITATYTSDNASFDNSNGGLVADVSPAPLTVTAANPSKVYGAALPSLTYTTSTLVNGDTTATALTGRLRPAPRHPALSAVMRSLRVRLPRPITRSLSCLARCR